MRSLTKKMHKGQKGLTLIELLIVVAILGIIAAVVIPNLGGFMVTGRISAANTELENVKTAALAYYAEYEAWPEDTSVAGEGNVEGVGYNARTAGTFSDYLAGDLNAVYLFCEHFGWVNDVALDPAHTWQGISFQLGEATNAGPPPSGGSHGRWVRA